MIELRNGKKIKNIHVKICDDVKIKYYLLTKEEKIDKQKYYNLLKIK